jgi:hypothetical protein
MIEFDEEGLPVSVEDGVPIPLTFQQRLYRALVDLSDIVAEGGYFEQGDLVKTINTWSTDPPLPESAEDIDATEIEVGMDQMKLFHAIEMQETAEELVEAHVTEVIREFEEQPDFDAMDQIDLIIYEQERELEKNAQGVAYLTASINQDYHTAHDIIDEQGCTLTHLLTQWFVLYMLSHETPDDGDSPVDAIRKRVGLMGMENAKAAAITPSQRRGMLEEQIHHWRVMTGQIEEDGDEDGIS